MQWSLKRYDLSITVIWTLLKKYLAKKGTKTYLQLKNSGKMRKLQDVMLSESQ